MDKAQGVDFDPRDLDFSSLDVWEKIWKMSKGCPKWHYDYVDPYVDNIMYTGAASPLQPFDCKQGSGLPSIMLCDTIFVSHCTLLYAMDGH